MNYLNEILSNKKAALSIFLAVVTLFAFSFNKLNASPTDTLDTQGPKIKIESHCGEYWIDVRDDQSYWFNQDTFHIDEGIVEGPVILNGLSYNISEILSSTFENDKINYDFTFRLNVLNKFEEAKVVFFVVDKSNQFTFDSIIYKPEALIISPPSFSFGNVYVASSKLIEGNIRNNSGFDFKIITCKLKSGIHYFLNEDLSNQNINYNEILNFSVTFIPQFECKGTENIRDTLEIITNCLVYQVPLIGTGVIPKIIVDDIDFGTVEVNTTAFYNSDFNPNFSDGLKIANPGTGTLVVNGYYDLPPNSPFSISVPSTPDVNNFNIPPDSEIFLKEIKFEPKSKGEYFSEIIFKNNANGPDSICKIRAIAYEPGAHLSSLNFGRVRIGDSRKGYVTLKNSGQVPIDVVGFSLSVNNPEFRVLINETMPFVSSQNPVRLYPDRNEFKDKITEIKVAIEYFSIYEFDREVKIFPIISGVNQDSSIFNYIRGFGYKPAIRARGYDFLGRTLVNVRHPDPGNIQIFSESWSSNLYIRRIDILPVGFTQKEEFIFINGLPSDTMIAINQPLVIPVSFFPREAGEREVILRILSDAYTGPENLKWDTIFISVKGNSYNKVISVESVLFDSLFHCSTSELFFNIRNVSDTTNAIIHYIEKISGDTNAFEIEYFDSYIEPLGNITIRSKFTPDSDKKNYELLIKVYSDVDTSIGIIRANTYKNQIITMLPTINNITPGTLLDKDNGRRSSQDFNISADFSEVIELDISSFEYDIIYNKRELLFSGVIKSGDINEGWTEFSYEEVDYDSEHTLLKISGIGNTSLSGLSGIVCRPVFLLLLGDTNSIEIKLNNVDYGVNNRCFENEMIDGLIKLSYCGDEVRKVVIANRFFDIKSLSGNPINKGIAELNYSVAFDALTRVEIFNQTGESIQILSNGYMLKGEYNRIVDLSNFSSGVYYITMISGPFAKSIPLIIIK